MDWYYSIIINLNNELISNKYVPNIVNTDKEHIIANIKEATKYYAKKRPILTCIESGGVAIIIGFKYDDYDTEIRYASFIYFGRSFLYIARCNDYTWNVYNPTLNEI